MGTSPAPLDAYHKLLGIPPAEQPPNHYRLLGISLFESDPDVIDGAASRQMAHVQKSATGPHAAHSQKLLSELAAARLSLLNEERKAEYDRKLKETFRRARKERLEKRSSRTAKMKSESGERAQSTANTRNRDRSQHPSISRGSISTPVPTVSPTQLPSDHRKVSTRSRTVVWVSCIVLPVVAIGTFLTVRSSNSVAEPVQLVESPSVEPLRSIEPTVEPKQAIEPEHTQVVVVDPELVASGQEHSEPPAHSLTPIPARDDATILPTNDEPMLDHSPPDPAATKSPPIPRPIPWEDPPKRFGPWRDLLPDVEPWHAIHGRAERKGTSLRLLPSAIQKPKLNVAAVSIPTSSFDPTDDYELDFSFTLSSGKSVFTPLIAVSGDKYLFVSLTGERSQYPSGILTTDLPNSTSNLERLRPNRRYRLQLSYSIDEDKIDIEAKLDEKALFSWSGNTWQFHDRPDLRFHSKSPMTIGAVDGTVTIHELRARTKQ